MIKQFICEWLGHRWELYDEKNDLFTYRCVNCGEVRTNNNKEFADRVKEAGSSKPKQTLIVK
jgi:hypothetical protein